MSTAFWALIGIAATALVAAYQFDASNPKQRLFFIAAAITATAAGTCLIPLIVKWLGARGAGRVLIECGPEFDTRQPSPRCGTVHICKLRITNKTGRLLTNCSALIANMTPEHQGQHNFLLKDNITLEDSGSILLSIASHVEGVPESSGLMSLQLPVFGGFYMPSGYGIVTGEQQFSIVFKQRDAVLNDMRFRLLVNDINVMRICKIH